VQSLFYASPSETQLESGDTLSPETPNEAAADSRSQGLKQKMSKSWLSVEVGFSESGGGVELLSTPGIAGTVWPEKRESSFPIEGSAPKSLTTRRAGYPPPFLTIRVRTWQGDGMTQVKVLLSAPFSLGKMEWIARIAQSLRKKKGVQLISVWHFPVMREICIRQLLNFGFGLNRLVKQRFHE
jgi:hypothetical protein